MGESLAIGGWFNVGGKTGNEVNLSFTVGSWVELVTDKTRSRV